MLNFLIVFFFFSELSLNLLNYIYEFLIINSSFCATKNFKNFKEIYNKTKLLRIKILYKNRYISGTVWTDFKRPFDFTYKDNNF